MSLVRPVVSVLLLAALAAPLSLLRVRTLETWSAAATYEDIYYLPSPEWLKVVSLGHHEALADLIWMRALVYFGEEVAHRGQARHVFQYTEAMLALDQDFRAPYHWIATAALYGNAELTPAEVRRAVDIMERGLTRFPDDGELAWDIGATLAFELPPLLDDPEDDADAHRDAAPYLMMAARLGAAPEWMALTNASMLSHLGQVETAAQHLEEMYAMTRDEGTRARIAQTIGQLRSQLHAETLVEWDRRLEEQRLREMPYVSPGLFPLLREVEGERWQDSYRDGFARSLSAEDDLALDELTN
jgi:hypothetical protein